MPLPSGGVYTLSEAAALAGLTEDELKQRLMGKGVLRSGKGMCYLVEHITPLMQAKKLRDARDRLKSSQDEKPKS